VGAKEYIDDHTKPNKVLMLLLIKEKSKAFHFKVARKKWKENPFYC